MQEKIEIYFIDHCDDGMCGLGVAEFSCPVCKKRNIDYGDVWYSFTDYGFVGDEKDVVKTNCEYCKIDLTLVRMNDGNFNVIF